MAAVNAKKQPPIATTSSPARSYKPSGSARTTARSSTPSKDKDIENTMKTDPSTPKPKEGSKVGTPSTPFSAKGSLTRRGTNISVTAEPSEQELEIAVEMEEL